MAATAWPIGGGALAVRRSKPRNTTAIRRRRLRAQMNPAIRRVPTARTMWHGVRPRLTRRTSTNELPLPDMARP
ncbi:uncharacterized protein CTRU02_215530 [Colletotrichum truncatum]|uniref:Uncharacterized protein n=1 Tax=Colletotrichum truncatum TaxID=5467 RepID=A0ACC3YCQ1_COLTU|nr:uncharacterized protein CTRU02_05526 [Colletotrichum truncatum]KAF6793969.1 hypothetical protein CTRU02_05526 [Colletotrichum truncatum]